MFDTPLMMAAMVGDLEGVRENLGEARRQDEWGRTALMWATFNDNLECAKLLLSELGMQANDGETALMKAADRGHSNIIPLLEKETGMQDEDGWTALMYAALNGKTDCARLLLSEAGKQSTGRWYNFPPGATALMIAAHYNRLEIVKLLLPYEQGLKDSNGNTAKWHANNGESCRGDFTQVRKLLENEGTERIPPPPNPAEMLKLSRENESLKKELSSTKNAREEEDERLAQSNREVSSLKEQLDKTTEENDALHKQLEDEKKQGKARNDKFSAEVESLQEQLSSSKNDLEETKKESSQLSREVSALKEQLSKTTEALSNSHTDSEALKRELADQKAKVLALEEENVQLKSEIQDVRNLQAERDDLQRRLEEAEERNRDLLNNLVAAGGRLVTGSIDQDS